MIFNKNCLPVTYYMQQHYQTAHLLYAFFVHIIMLYFTDFVYSTHHNNNHHDKIILHANNDVKMHVPIYICI